MIEKQTDITVTTFAIGKEHLVEVRKFALDRNISMAELVRRALDEYMIVHSMPKVEGGEG